MDFGGGDDIRFERRGSAGLIALARPQALNAINYPMLRAIAAALDAWEADDAVATIVITGEGRAFCAGGDLLDLYTAHREGRSYADFFADEYRLNARIAGLKKPYVALVDGLVMGGGVGVSFHGSHRVMTENAQFAMPECGIGFFPDVGGSHILSRLMGGFGMYLGLTGTRVRHGDALWSKLATHAVAAADLPALADAIAESGDTDASLTKICRQPPRETDDATLHEIAQHFSRGSLDAVVESLRQVAPASAFAKRTLETLGKKSPTSLAVAFAAIESGAALEIDECMAMEFRIVNRMLAGHDFFEGIRATIVDKGDTPAWRPPTLAEVSQESVDAYFAPLPDGDLSAGELAA